ncbi:MAG TPA: efflux RND transporter permease subunit [Thermoanaerobaculia bacterium]|nr:efflux RND transporter permease subunit [Thermoanaerobaculia bacterium]
MKLIDFSLRRRVTVSMCAVALVMFGIVSFQRLPINLLPDISYPSLTVETRFPGAAPAEVETLVTRPVEEVVGIVTGVKRLTSVSRPGLSQVTLEFDWGRDMDFAALDVRQKLDLLTLPRESDKPVLLRFDPANDPVVRLYVTGTDNLYQLRYVAEEVLKKDLESTEGVAAIKVNGGFEDEIQVRVDEGKLSLMGLAIGDVNQKLRRENVNQAGGSLYEKEARYLVRSKNEFVDLQDIMDTVLVTRDGRNVMMSDVAEVIRSHKQREVITRFGGKEAAELAIYKEGDANIVSVARSLQQRLDRVKKELPEGIEVVTGVDQSRFIRASVDEVLSNALLGGAIAIIVLLFFLKHVRSTVIVGISIPISVVATFFLMYQTGTTLNIMSLGGLALGVGMLVDNAIVVLESIFKKREAGADSIEAANTGASEVGMAVVASTLTTVAVFLPVVFLEGIAAQLFKDQALTVSFSLIASLAVSLTLIPMMAALAGRRSESTDEEPGAGEAGRMRRFGRAVFVSFPAGVVRLVRWLLRHALRGVSFAVRPLSRGFDKGLSSLAALYPRLLDWSLRSRAIVIGVVAILFAVALLTAPRLGLDLIPSFTQGEFHFQVDFPEGTPLEATDRFIQNVQSVLEGEDLVGSWSTIAGSAGLSLSNTGTEGENSARIQVQMKPGSSSADEEKVIGEVRSQLESFGSARYKFERPTYFTFRTPIEVEVYGDNLEEIREVSRSLKADIEKIGGLVDVKSSADAGNPELQVRFRREHLAQLGLDLSQVAETVRSKVQGEVATRFTQGDREIDILVRSVDVGTASVTDVNEMIIGQIEGRPIFLASVADVLLTEGPSEVRRIGQKRAVVISGNLSGRNMASVAADVRGIIAAASYPAGVTATLSGQEEEMRRSIRSLLMAMALAIFLVYLVMASQFESFLHPFVIIFTLPLGAIGVIGALAISGRSISIVAMIGMVMLAGIVVNNAIVLIDAVNQLRRSGVPRNEALLRAGSMRLRPILMTSMTTILGLLPMALGLGEGAELRSPLAITVIGGLTVATMLTLIVIPVVYSLLDRKKYPADLEAASRVEHPEGSTEPWTAPAMQSEPGTAG